jgi:hypothetical protein
MPDLTASQARDAAEREQVKAAAERLLSGSAVRSSGRLNAVALAEEAGINRTRLYDHHFDVLADFKARAGLDTSSPSLAAMSGKLDAAQERIAELADENARLKERIRTLSAIIVELSLDADRGRPADIVPLRGHPSHRDDLQRHKS